MRARDRGLVAALAAVALLGPSCRRDDPEAYCAARDEAWARAHPGESRAKDFVASCAAVVAGERARDPSTWARRQRCLREHVHPAQSGKAALDAYLALARCERGGDAPAP